MRADMLICDIITTTWNQNIYSEVLSRYFPS